MTSPIFSIICPAGSVYFFVVDVIIIVFPGGAVPAVVIAVVDFMIFPALPAAEGIGAEEITIEYVDDQAGQE